MNINHLADQLKDVPQNKLIGYAQNPNSVVPQYLALAEIQRRKTLQSTPQAPQGTVAEDLLAGAQQEQMAQQQAPGVAQLPTGSLYKNDETFSAANGGIVAFAGGGYSEDEEETGGISFEDKDHDSMMSKLRGLLAKLPQSYATEKARVSNTQQQEQAAPTKTGNHPYEKDAIEAARKVGLDPNVMLHALYKETGNLKDPATAKSKAGAYGPMQLMAGTAKDLGVDRTDPMQNIYGGALYLKQQMDKYQDPQLALAAYNAGPGRVDKALKSELGIAALPRETQGYIKMAEGGVASYKNGGPTKEDLEKALGALAQGMPEDYDKYTGEPMSQSDYYRKRKIAENAIKSNLELPKAPISEEQKSVYRSAYGQVPAMTAPKPAMPSQKEFDQFDRAAELFQKEQMGAKPMAPASPAVQPPVSPMQAGAPEVAPKEDYFSELKKMLSSSKEELAKDKEQNKYLALLNAGLGMMGGKSQYWMENVGTGGAQGVAAYGALKKGEQAQARDILSGQLGMSKYQNEAEYNKAIKEATLGQRQAEMGQRGLLAARDDFKQYQADFENRLLKKYPKVAMGLKDPAYDAELASFYNSPEYLSLKKQAFPSLPIAGGGSSAVTIPSQAIEALKKDPSLKSQFDAKFGAGSSAKYLGQ
jgi:hypothetical protein